MSMNANDAIDWQTFRDRMPVCRRWVFLDHAAVAPLSLPAQQAMLEWAGDQAENGVVNSARWSRRIEQVRGMAARLLDAETDEIAFVKNTSEGLGFVAEGFPWREGDNVVSVEGEYPSNVYPWMNLARRGVELRRVATREGRVAPDDIRDALDGRTRLVTISFVEYGTGFRNDLDALCELCHGRGALLCVDAIQGLGALPLDMGRTPIDFLAADGHKWLLAPEGAGLFYCRKEHLDLLETIGVGWNSVVGADDYATIDFTLKPSAGRWESGSYNVGGIAALGGSLSLILEVGIENVARRMLELTDYLCRRIEEAGGTVYSSRREGEKSGIVSVIWPGADPVAVRHRCREQGIAINSREGRLRISPHCYNTHEELDRLVDVLTAG
jgi:cysteine desulfurase/selenocysteine lyase